MAIRLRRRPRAWVLMVGAMSAVFLVIVALGLSRPLPSYLVARDTIAPGALLTEDDFQMVAMDLGPLAEKYATTLEPGLSVTSLVEGGELIAKSRFQNYMPIGLTSVRLTPSSRPSTATRVGSYVAVWQVLEVEEVLSSQLLVPRALVTAIAEPEGLFADAAPEIELQLFTEKATLVIAALAADLPIFVLPTP